MSQSDGMGRDRNEAANADRARPRRHAVEILGELGKVKMAVMINEHDWSTIDCIGQRLLPDAKYRSKKPNELHPFLD